MNFKTIFLLIVLVFGMGLTHTVAAANTFSGFVDNSGSYLVFSNSWPEWTVEEYDIMGKRIVNSPWMSKHKEVGLITKTKVIRFCSVMLNI